ncbi:MAG: hypothetical protein OHK0023_00800 [Anaerolineae bacterium]
MRKFALMLVVALIAISGIMPAQAQGIVYGVTVTCPDRTINIVRPRAGDPVGYHIFGPGVDYYDDWPLDVTGAPANSVSYPVPQDGTYLVEVYESSEDTYSTNVTVNCSAPPGEPLDDVSTDGDLVIGSEVKVYDTDGKIKTAQVFARLLRPTYLGNRSIIDIPFIRAVDVFVFLEGKTFKGAFAEALTVCLRGTGQSLFAPVSGTPRAFGPADVAPSIRSGFSCVYLGQPGTFALVKPQ